LSCPEMKRLVSASSAHASTSSHSKCAALATIGRRARDGRLVVRGTPRWPMPPACIDIKALVIEVSQSRLALPSSIGRTCVCSKDGAARALESKHLPAAQSDALRDRPLDADRKPAYNHPIGW
jgi:hypothetical protein